MRKLWICSQIGWREHYSIPNALHKAGCLKALVTDWYAPENPFLKKLVAMQSRAALAARSEKLPSELVHSFPFRSLLWKRQIKANLAKIRTYEAFEQTNRLFAMAAGRLKLPGHDLFFGYSYASLETMEVEKKRGVRTIVDQIDPGEWEVQLVNEEMARYPKWAGEPAPVPRGYFEKNLREWDCADKVVVNSSFCRKALVNQGVPEEKIFVMPLCYEGDPAAPGLNKPARNDSGPLRVLFLGQVILRKGIHYLLKAFSLLDPDKVSLDIVGTMGLLPGAWGTLPPHVRYHGRATRDEIAGWYSQADVFILPTLSDGFAITQLMAMSYGLPVVATPCCGDVVTDGADGFLIPPRDAEAIAGAIQKYAANRELLASHSRAALEKSRQFTEAALLANLERLEAEIFDA